MLGGANFASGFKWIRLFPISPKQWKYLFNFTDPEETQTALADCQYVAAHMAIYLGAPNLSECRPY